jgi:hypothetical protein
VPVSLLLTLPGTEPLLVSISGLLVHEDDGLWFYCGQVRLGRWFSLLPHLRFDSFRLSLAEGGPIFDLTINVSTG